jgi:hypothetical protein
MLRTWMTISQYHQDHSGQLVVWPLHFCERSTSCMQEVMNLMAQRDVKREP